MRILVPVLAALIGVSGCTHGSSGKVPDGSTGGVTGSGGRAATGGTPGSGGASGSAGAAGTGGSVAATGGTLGNGGVTGASGGVSGGSSGSGGASGAGGGASGARPLGDLQRDYIDLRFGMFMHFGILTFCGSQPGDPCPGSWAQPNLAINNFNPSANYNPGQWADAAVSAHMKFGVLTTRHHDGFALWPSAASTFNVGHISWKNGQGDVVRDYVDAFRSRGLLPGLYYSIWDATQGIGNTSPITPAQLAYVKAQITELLTNYGPIPILVLDGWSWKMGHQAVAYQAIRELVKSLQPNCLLTDHTHLNDPWDADVMNFEEPTGSFAPVANTIASEQDTKINASGGNDWFWAPNIGSLMPVTTIVGGHLTLLEPRYTNFILNCPPNRDGLLDPAIVTTLAAVGAAWSPNLSRAPLPAQAPIVEHPYTPVSATATSGVAANAIDGLNDTSTHTFWQTSGAFPQSVTLDLGQIYPDVGMLAYLPQYSLAAGGSGLPAGAITTWGILLSSDGTTFVEAGNGTWPADGKMHTATFGPSPARYVRLEARAAMGASAFTTDITVGANR